MEEKFKQFFDKYNGKPVEVNDPSNPFQCMDLAYAFVDFINIPRDTLRHLYAYEVYTKPNDLTVKYFELVPNTANGMPQVGDLVIFGKTINGTAGHISIAKGEGNTNTFVSFDQNFGTTVKKAGLITHSYDHVLGWLRPRVTALPQPLPIPDGFELIKTTDLVALREKEKAYDDLKRAYDLATNSLMENEVQIKRQEEEIKRLTDLLNQPTPPPPQQGEYVKAFDFLGITLYTKK